MILEPEQDKEEPSAVRSLTPEVEEETGAGKPRQRHRSPPETGGKKACPKDTLEKNQQEG